MIAGADPSGSGTAQTQGVGQALMDECVHRTRRMGAAELACTARRACAPPSDGRMGFERTPEHAQPRAPR
ncbi:MAG TPA: hypothetical protein VK399_07220 [Longimicrobiaceae bacterium]|nr:hypothetical protein [Longimicrobiaceae bacterium]